MDASQARHELDLRPRLNLDDAVRWTVDWYRRQRAGEDAAALIRAQIADYAASRAV